MEKRSSRKRRNKSDINMDIIKRQRPISDYFVSKAELKSEIKDEIKNEVEKKINVIDNVNDDIVDQKNRKDICYLCKRHTFIPNEISDGQLCNNCQQSTDVKANLESKKPKIVKTRKYACKICDKVLINKVRFAKHQRMHENQRKFQCSHCDQTFKYLIHLAKHNTVVHNTNVDPSKSICPICNKLVTFLPSHLRWHKEDPMDCEICGVTLRNKSVYISHKNVHNLIVRKNIERVIVPKSMQRRNTVTCNICDKNLYMKDFLSHIRSHFEPYFFVCWNCENGSLKTITELLEHFSRSHRSIPEPYIECIACREIHEDIGEHLKCHSLEFQYDQRENYTFDDEKSCQKYINRRMIKDTKAEEKRRRKMKPNMNKVKCLICHQKVCISHVQSHLKKHQSYQCQLCKKKCLSLDSYNEHKLTHSLKESRCLFCDKSFLNHVRLIAHSQMVHNINFLESRPCPRCKIK